MRFGAAGGLRRQWASTRHRPVYGAREAARCTLTRLPSAAARCTLTRLPSAAASLQDQCSFNGAWRGKTGSGEQRTYYVSSYFWDRALEAGIIADAKALRSVPPPLVNGP